MTNLILRDPVNDLLPIFSRQMNPFLQSPLSFDTGLSSTVNGPAVVVYETKDEYVFQAELPGWTRDQISIDFENQTLTLSGQRDLGEKTVASTIALKAFMASSRGRLRYPEWLISIRSRRN